MPTRQKPVGPQITRIRDTMVRGLQKARTNYQAVAGIDSTAPAKPTQANMPQFKALYKMPVAPSIGPDKWRS